MLVSSSGCYFLCALLLVGIFISRVTSIGGRDLDGAVNNLRLHSSPHY